MSDEIRIGQSIQQIASNIGQVAQSTLNKASNTAIEYCMNLGSGTAKLFEGTLSKPTVWESVYAVGDALEALPALAYSTGVQMYELSQARQKFNELVVEAGKVGISIQKIKENIPSLNEGEYGKKYAGLDIKDRSLEDLTQINGIFERMITSKKTYLTWEKANHEVFEKAAELGIIRSLEDRVQYLNSSAEERNQVINALKLAIHETTKLPKPTALLNELASLKTGLDEMGINISAYIKEKYQQQPNYNDFYALGQILEAKGVGYTGGASEKEIAQLNKAKELGNKIIDDEIAKDSLKIAEENQKREQTSLRKEISELLSIMDQYKLDPGPILKQDLHLLSSGGSIDQLKEVKAKAEDFVLKGLSEEIKKNPKLVRYIKEGFVGFDEGLLSGKSPYPEKTGDYIKLAKNMLEGDY